MFIQPIYKYACIGAMIAFATFCEADVVVEISALGSDTMVSVTGSLEFEGLTPSNSTTHASRLNLNPGFSGLVSAGVGAAGYTVDLTPFGTAPTGSIAISDPGFWVAYIDPQSTSAEQIFMSSGYVSGTNMNSSLMLSGHSLSDLNLSVGDNWGVSFPIYDSTGSPTSTSQSLTFRAVQAVPEPSPFMLLGLLAVFAGLRKRLA